IPIRVDLPAPFSPTMPWIEPALTTSEMFRFAWTSPNHLSIPRSSIAAPVSAFTSAFISPLRAAALPPQSWGEAGRQRALRPAAPVGRGGEAPLRAYLAI